MNINNEIRKQLRSFLEKVITQSYERLEWEKLAISIYQDDELETIRVAMVKAITEATKEGAPPTFSEDMKASIQLLIDELTYTIQE